MLNLIFTLIAAPASDKRDAEDGFLGKLALWVGERIRYARALHELRQLDDRDLADLDIAPVDFPELAWRHATGEAPRLRVR